MNPFDFARAEAKRQGVDPELVMRLISAESGGNQGAISKKGAIGLGQLMPNTAKDMGVNPKDPFDNIRGSIKYLGQQLKSFNGDVPLALAAYNAGPGAVRKYGGIPPFAETQNYVKKINGGGMPTQKAQAKADDDSDIFGNLSTSAPAKAPAQNNKSTVDDDSDIFGFKPAANTQQVANTGKRKPLPSIGGDTTLAPPSAMESIGRGMTDILDKTRQLTNPINPFTTKKEDAANEKRISEDLKLYEKGRGKEAGIDWGRLGGNAAPMIAGSILAAPTIAAQGAIGLLGGATANPVDMSQPNADLWGSTAGDAIIGGLAGGAGPLIGKAGKFAKTQFIDRFTDAGKTKAAAAILNKQAGNLLKGTQAEQNAAIEALASQIGNIRGATQGFNPTVGQGVQNSGLSTLERASRSANPQAFEAVNAGQTQSILDAINGIRQTPEARSALQALTDEKAKSLYGPALRELMDVTPDLSNISTRPSMNQAEARARKLAAEEGSGFRTSMQDLVPKFLNTDPQQQIATVIKNKTGAQQAFGAADESMTSRGIRPDSPFFELPALESVPVKDMHYIKMGLDALLSDPTLGIAAKEANAIKATRGKLLDLMPETYQNARLSHIEMNKPVNQIDIAEALYKKLVPALADSGGDVGFRMTPNSFAQGLREGDQLAKDVVGLKNAKITDIMSPEQMKLLQGIQSDTAMKAAGAQRGMGVGSNTFQNLSTANRALSGSGLGGGIPSAVLKELIGTSNQQISQRVAELLADPRTAAEALKMIKTNPSVFKDLIAKLPQLATPYRNEINR